MVKHLKRWESPRKQGRNIKGRGGAARLRQIKKQQKILRKKLNNQEKGNHGSLFFCLFISTLVEDSRSPFPLLFHPLKAMLYKHLS
ncbi:hypothetical protein [Dapis sp. BLCC M229]|uniref:hypothetical protein n=1 Tax=Dapis sp. BLCC M229 TaxID=3400188 RepID=UPI003CE73A87